jgi:hypothetical protein
MHWQPKPAVDGEMAAASLMVKPAVFHSSMSKAPSLRACQWLTVRTLATRSHRPWLRHVQSSWLGPGPRYGASTGRVQNASHRVGLFSSGESQRFEVGNELVLVLSILPKPGQRSAAAIRLRVLPPTGAALRMVAALTRIGVHSHTLRSL